MEDYLVIKLTVLGPTCIPNIEHNFGLATMGSTAVVFSIALCDAWVLGSGLDTLNHDLT